MSVVLYVLFAALFLLATMSAMSFVLATMLAFVLPSCLVLPRQTAWSYVLAMQCPVLRQDMLLPGHRVHTENRGQPRYLPTGLIRCVRYYAMLRRYLPRGLLCWGAKVAYNGGLELRESV